MQSLLKKYYAKELRFMVKTIITVYEQSNKYQIQKGNQ